MLEGQVFDNMEPIYDEFLYNDYMNKWLDNIKGANPNINIENEIGAIFQGYKNNEMPLEKVKHLIDQQIIAIYNSAIENLKAKSITPTPTPKEVEQSNVNANIPEPYKSNNIYTPEDLFKFLDKEVDYGIHIDNPNGHPLNLPMGIHGPSTKNKTFRFNNPEVINFISWFTQKYGTPQHISITEDNIKMKNPNDPNTIALYQMITNYVLNKSYVQNSIDSVVIHKIATGNEQMEFAARFLEALNCQVKRMTFSIVNEGMPVDTNYFLAYEKDGKWYHFESILPNFKGIHEYDNFEELCTVVPGTMMLAKATSMMNTNAIISSNNFILTELPRLESGLKYEQIIGAITNGPRMNLANAEIYATKLNDIKNSIVAGEITLNNVPSPITLAPSEIVKDVNHKFFAAPLENVFTETASGISFVLDKDGTRTSESQGSPAIEQGIARKRVLSPEQMVTERVERGDAKLSQEGFANIIMITIIILIGAVLLVGIGFVISVILS